MTDPTEQAAARFLTGRDTENHNDWAVSWGTDIKSLAQFLREPEEAARREGAAEVEFEYRQYVTKAETKIASLLAHLKTRHGCDMKSEDRTMTSDLLCDKCCRFLGRVYVADIGETFCRECLAEARREGFREGAEAEREASTKAINLVTDDDAPEYDAEKADHADPQIAYILGWGGGLYKAVRVIRSLPLPEKA